MSTVDLSNIKKINLSDKTKIISVFDGSKSDDVKSRDIERRILIDLLEFAFINEKNGVKSLDIATMRKKVKELDEDVNEITLSEQDVESLKKAYDETAGKRPPFWIDFSEFISQIVK